VKTAAALTFAAMGGQILPAGGNNVNSVRYLSAGYTKLWVPLRASILHLLTKNEGQGHHRSGVSDVTSPAKWTTSHELCMTLTQVQLLTYDLTQNFKLNHLVPFPLSSDQNCGFEPSEVTHVARQQFKLFTSL